MQVPSHRAQDPHQLQVLKWHETGLNREILEQHFTFSLPEPCNHSLNPFLSKIQRAFSFLIFERFCFNLIKLHCQNLKQIEMKQLICENMSYKLVLKKCLQ